MSFAVPQVFISSTSEFAEERKALAQSLKSLPDFDFHPFIYEEEAAGPRSPEQHCQAMLDQSEIVVLILGASYGSAFPGRPTSIVEWEYEYAKDARKELKGYLRDPLGDVHPSQAQFVARARSFRSGTWMRTFSHAPQLIAHVIADVKQWRLDSWKALQALSSERKRWKDRLVLATSAVVAVATVGGVIAGAVAGIPAGKLALILASGVAMLAALGWLLKWDPV
jgi:hypothetical protein